jgi:large subunit ribosomal protein L13
MMIIIDGRDLILGRIASYVAKRLLDNRDEQISLINAEKIVVSGSKKAIEKRYSFMREVGDIYKGPFFPRMSDRIVRRTIRSMLPFKKTTGREAFKRVMVYIGEPKELSGDKVDGKDLLKFNKSILKDQKYRTLAQISECLGRPIKNEEVRL